MSNSEPSDPSPQSNENYVVVEQSHQRDEASDSGMAVHPIPEPSNCAQPFSGSAGEMTSDSRSSAGGQTDVYVHPANDTSSCTYPLHVPNHIRTKLVAPTPDSSTAQQACSTRDRPSSERTTVLDTSQVLMDNKKASTLDEKLEVMSIGDREGTDRTCGNLSGGSDAGHTDRATDDESVISSKGGQRKQRDRSIEDQIAGRWTAEEHQEFLEGLKIFGREWKKVAERIPTRTSAQIRSHAQKYFAKLARDESIMFQEQASAAAMVASPQEPSAAHDIVPLKSLMLSESVQRNVDRILADPSSLEKEVEDTLHALRERYLQLQIRLEMANRRNSGEPQSPPRSHVVETEDGRLSRIPRQPRPILDKRKRVLEDCSDGSAQRRYHEDMSSVSSACFSPTRELVDEELIALSVLGDSLSRSASHLELPHAASSEENSHDDALRQAQNASPASSIGSHREPLDDADDRSDQAKKLKLSDEDTETTTNERSGEEGDSFNRDDMIL